AAPPLHHRGVASRVAAASLHTRHLELSALRYISTRGAAPALAFDDVLLAGLARDGGLYVPEEWPLLTGNDLRALVGLEYADIATRVMRPFVGGRLEEAAFARLGAGSQGDFGPP